jgi:hypothetical protein
VAKIVLSPGIPIPKLNSGDTVIIHGKSFMFRGKVKNLKSIPQNVIGLYLCEDSMNYYLHHPREQNQDIIKEYSKKMIDDIANDTSIVTREKQQREIFIIPIYPDDNYLKVLVKKILMKIKIDLNDYRDKFTSDNHYNNTRRSLISHSTLSYEKFCEFLDIIGYKHSITILNNDSTIFDFEEHMDRNPL